MSSKASRQPGPPVRIFRFGRAGAGLIWAVALAGCSGTIPAPSRLDVRSTPDGWEAVLSGTAADALRHRIGMSAPSSRVEPYFHIRRADAAGQLPPVISRLEWRTDGSARLTPRVSLDAGRAYRVRFRGALLGPGLPDLEEEFTPLATRAASPARVTSVYPTSSVLPANLLKFYVHFSEPMAEGRLFEHARLLDDLGRPIDQAFREVELWSPDHRRVTLWINPGRTKRALGLSESLGPVLQPGRDYTLEIAAGLPDQRGRLLAEGLRHPFRTTETDHRQPDIERWRLGSPRQGSRDPLLVVFDEPLDRALAERLVDVVREGTPLPGAGRVTEGERGWSFIPERPWPDGELWLVAAGDLEDLAGNSLWRAFETFPDEGRQPTTDPPLFRRRLQTRAATPR